MNEEKSRMSPDFIIVNASLAVIVIACVCFFLITNLQAQDKPKNPLSQPVPIDAGDGIESLGRTFPKGSPVYVYTSGGREYDGRIMKLEGDFFTLESDKALSIINYRYLEGVKIFK